MLTPRLQTVLELITQCETLADIGTDHAYLPIEAVGMGLCKKAIACDVNKGPLEIAAANIHAAGFPDTIETRLGDGIKPLGENEADCIAICGMGGALIIKILEQDLPKARHAKLILQPQYSQERLRRYLHSANFTFSEELVAENSRYYTILCATYTGVAQAYTNSEYFIGKLGHSPVFPQYLQHLQYKISRYIQQITDTATREKAEEQLRWIEYERSSS